MEAEGKVELNKENLVDNLFVSDTEENYVKTQAEVTLDIKSSPDDNF